MFVYGIQIGFTALITIAITTALAVLYIGRRRPRVSGATVTGRRFRAEPSFLLKIRFLIDAYGIIGDAYHKFKDSPFVVRRFDADITVLPIKYLKELRVTSRHILSCKRAQIGNLVPRWTWTSVMIRSDLHVKVLNEKLNPNLTAYVEDARTELEHVWEPQAPNNDGTDFSDWTSIEIQPYLCKLVASMSARVFMGPVACQDPKWLKLSVDFTHDVFLAAFTLRMFPPELHWLVAQFIPSRWRIRRHISVASSVLKRTMVENQERSTRGLELQDNLLDWMYDHGTPSETEVTEMAARQCVMTLASIHTTSLTVTNFLFDLCTYPEWFSVLLDEIASVMEKHGALGENPDMPARLWLQGLEKMDSFLVESQRHNPLILLMPQRIAMTPLKLSDGTEIPMGTRIAWAGHHHGNDVGETSDPCEFDPLRSYRKRHNGDGENLTRFIAGQTDINNLSFGYGNQACPGRYFAVSEIKLLVTKLLLSFDFRLPEGECRPSPQYAEENVFTDPRAKIEIRKKVDQT